ncbi:carotenoid oxygenase family protein [Nonomuraea cavernae]|uniref:Dioxygenase n=1 Tax=Nonomuraea cavernae TaxID=2045107 RepID=A0A917Z4J5_9ACTN|nr:carotenoid oxygenase family protein [Nonomuraea cavernae]MCA2188283.1 carotenoid oxygenase family protein [Nonomuraea cavernae]GGO73766.1 retinal pigment epithelial membrane protein [Nonomuraea cavernae]
MTTPYYLSGTLAPVPDETDAHDLPVTGALPPELAGRYFRNGPNPRPGENPGHWFAGHGMIHGIRLNEGRAEWYRNRWIRTKKFTDNAPFLGDQGLDLAAVTANTHVIRHGERILALVENGLPYEVTPELATVGPCDFGGRLTTAMTAHPKQDPVTGELHFFGYGFFPPFVTYHRVSAGGELVESREIEVAESTMMHDFAVTEHYLIWLDLPVVFDLERGAMPYAWRESYGARIGVTPRAGGPTRWFEIDPCYVFHVGNAWEDAEGRIVLNAARYAGQSFGTLWDRISGAQDPAGQAATMFDSVLHRWTLDPATGKVVDESLDDRPVEFPTFNDGLLGRTSRYLYMVSDQAVVKYDQRSGACLTHPTGGHTGEAVFAPAPGAEGEDDGWLLSVVTSGDASRLLVLDASDLSEVASVRLPRRVPAGFHGSWFEDQTAP